MTSVNTGSVEIREAICFCTGIIRILSASQNEILYKYRNTEKDWKDSKYQQLGEIINDCNNSYKKTLNELERCIVSLNKLEGNVKEYESTGFTNINNIVSSMVNQHSGIQLSIPGFFGGSYRKCKYFSNGKKEEIHHISANSINGLSKDCGPSIIMDTSDHKKTASYDNQPGAKAYREKQKNIIAEGRFLEAMQMDIDDIHFKFGDKYDEAIIAALNYADRLISEVRI